MIAAIIFDLDNCLSAADEPGEQLLEPVFSAIRAANHGALSEEQLSRAFSDAWRIPLDAVGEIHGFTLEMKSAGWNASLDLEVSGRMWGYADLPLIAELPGKKFLVTSGFRRLQESKIRALGFPALFDGIFVDAIDEPGRKGKQQIFAEIAAVRGWEPHEVWVVGDNPDSEIRAGNALGMHTVQIVRPGVPPSDAARHQVRGLGELADLLGAEGAKECRTRC